MTSSRTPTYRTAGVDIDAADRLVSRIARGAASTLQPGVLAGIGPFASAVRLPRGLRDPVLLSSTDGVGTKLSVAHRMNRHDTIGIDLVAMNANDLITAGARPLFFLDYLAVGKLASIDADAVLAGIIEGCKQAGMSLVGGETAEMPGFYANGIYELAGFCVGVAERRALVDGSRIRPGDAIVGLPASGLHSNGYSLARRVLGADRKASLRRRIPELGCSVGDALLEPTRIYVRPVLAALKDHRILGMAHITGGGLPGNLARSLPKGVRAVVDRATLPRLPILELIEQRGVARAEMDRTFHRGIGFTLIARPREADRLCTFFRRRRLDARIIGEVVAGRRGVSLRGR